MKYMASIKKYWNSKTLTEKDYNNLSSLMLVAIAWMLLWFIL